MNAAFSKLTSIGAAPAPGPLPVPPLTRELQQLVRAIPEKATGGDLVRFMSKAHALSGKQATMGPFRYGSREADAARKLLDEAVMNPFGIGIGSAGAVYGPGTSPRKKAVELATKAVAAASADFGRAGVKKEALQQLPRDIKQRAKDVAPKVLDAAKVALILGGSYMAASLLTRGKK